MNLKKRFLFFLMFTFCWQITTAQKKTIEINSLIPLLSSADSSKIVTELQQIDKKFKKQANAISFTSLGVTFGSNNDCGKCFIIKILPSKKTVINSVASANTFTLSEIRTYFNISNDNTKLINDFTSSGKSLIKLTQLTDGISTELLLVSPKQYFSSDIITTPIKINHLLEEGYAIKEIKLTKEPSSFEIPPALQETIDFFPPPPPEVFENVETYINQSPKNTYYLRFAINRFSHFQQFEKATEYAEKLAKLEPTEENILNLQELYLLNNQPAKALELQKKHYSSIITSEHRVLANFHVFVANLLTNKKDETTVKNIKEALVYLDFKNFSWSFDMLEKYIDSNKSINPTPKDEIIQLIADIKAANYGREEEPLSNGNYKEEGLSFEAPPPPAEVSLIISDEEPIFTSVEQNPEFSNDGISGMYKFIVANLNYPETARSLKISGKVFLKFIIEKDGSIGNEVQILKGIHPDCDAEAIRLVKSFPKWEPGYQNGRAVRVYYTIPIGFSLD